MLMWLKWNSFLLKRVKKGYLVENYHTLRFILEVPEIDITNWRQDHQTATSKLPYNYKTDVALLKNMAGVEARRE